MTPDAPQQPDVPSRGHVPEDPQPTEVLPAVDQGADHMPAAVPPAREDVQALDPATDPRSPYKLAVWILAGLVVVLLISVIAALASRGGSAPAASATPSPSLSASASATPTPSPSATPTPSPSPSEEPEPEETTEAPPPPPPPGPVFTSFSAPSTAACADEFSTAEVTLTWASSSATAAWGGIATDNAKSAPYSDVPTSGSVTLPFPCSNESQLYTVTLEDADGLLKHRSTTISRSLG